MKTTLINDENDNLVMFPSAKNFLAEEDCCDPMMDLLNEYSHMSDEDIPAHLDDRFEENFEENFEDTLEDETAFGSLEAFMARNQNQEVLGPDDKLIKLINERLSNIAEAKERIKFYLDEIEMFLPRRN